MPNRLAAHAASAILHGNSNLVLPHNRAPSVERLLTFWPRYLKTYQTRKYLHAHNRNGDGPELQDGNLSRNNPNAHERVGLGSLYAQKSVVELRSSCENGIKDGRSWNAHGASQYDYPTQQEINIDQERSQARSEPPGGWFVEDDGLGGASKHEAANAVSDTQVAERAPSKETHQDVSSEASQGPAKQWALRFYDGDEEPPMRSAFEAMGLTLETRLGHMSTTFPPTIPLVNGSPDNQVTVSSGHVPLKVQLEWTTDLILKPPSNKKAYEVWKSEIAARPDLWTSSRRQQPRNMGSHSSENLNFYRGCEMLISQYHPQLSHLVGAVRVPDTTPHRAESAADLGNASGTANQHHSATQTKSQKKQATVADPRASVWAAPFLDLQMRPMYDTLPGAASEDTLQSKEPESTLQRAWSALQVGLRTTLWPHILLHVIQYHPENAIALYCVMQQKQCSRTVDQGGSASDMPLIPRYTFLHTLLVRVVYGGYRPSSDFRNELFKFFKEDLVIFRTRGNISDRGRLNTIMRCIISLVDDLMIEELWNRLQSPLKQGDSDQTKNVSSQHLDRTAEFAPAISHNNQNRKHRSQNSTALTSFTMLHIAYRLAMAHKPFEALCAIRHAVDNGLSPSDARLSSVVNVILRRQVGTEDGYAASVSMTSQLFRMGVPINRILANVLILNAVNEGHSEAAIELYHAGLQGGVQPDGYTFDFTLRAIRILTTSSEQVEDIIQRAVQYALQKQDLFVANAVLRCAFSLARASIRHESNNDILDPVADIDQGRRIWESVCELYAKLFLKYPMEELGVWSMDSWFEGTDDGLDSDFVTISEEASWEGRVQNRSVDDVKLPSQTPLAPNAATITIMLQTRLLCMEQPPLSMIKDLFRRFWSLAKAGSQPSPEGDLQKSSNSEVRIPELTRAAESQHIWNMFIVAAGKSPQGPAQRNEAVAFALSIFRKMVQGGELALPEPSQWTFDSLLLACNRHRAVVASETIQQVMESRGLRRTQVTWNAIIDRYSHLQDIDSAAAAVSRMEADGYRIDAFTLKALRKFVGENRQNLSKMMQDSSMGSDTLTSNNFSNSQSDSVSTTHASQYQPQEQSSTYYTKGSFGGTNLGYLVEPEPGFFSSTSGSQVPRNTGPVQAQQTFGRASEASGGVHHHKRYSKTSSVYNGSASRPRDAVAESVGKVPVATTQTAFGDRILEDAATRARKTGSTARDDKLLYLAQPSARLLGEVRKQEMRAKSGKTSLDCFLASDLQRFGQTS